MDAVGPQSSAEFRALADELVATSAKLAESREREHRIEESRRELVAWIAHDLRTPLAGIMSMAEALEDELASDPQRYHRQMREQVTRLSAMVDDLFELSKIDSGTLRLSLQDVSLYDVISDTVADLRPMSQGREIRIEAGLGRRGRRARRPARAVAGGLEPAPERHPAHPGRVADHRRGLGRRRPRIDHGHRHRRRHRRGRPALACSTLAGAANPRARPSPQLRGARRSARARAAPDSGSPSCAGIAVAHQGEVTVRNVPGGCRFDLILPSAPAAARRRSRERQSRSAGEANSRMPVAEIDLRSQPSSPERARTTR